MSLLGMHTRHGGKHPPAVKRTLVNREIDFV